MNVLIVDDDLLIRNWLSLFLNQLDEYDINLYEASDGVEALEICRTNSIDLVITDIKMPRLDGLGLIDILKKDFPKIRYCVLSSYDDFDYVKIALKEGALDYILKAEMKIEDLSKLLDKTLNDFKFEKRVNSGEVIHLQKINNQKSLFKDFLDNKISQEELLKNLNAELELNNLSIVLFTVEPYENINKFKVSDICTNTLTGRNINAICLPLDSKYFLSMYNCSSNVLEEQEEEYIKLISVLNNNLNKYLNIYLSQSINIICKGRDDLRDKFNQGLSIMEFKKYYNISSNKVNINLGQSSNKGKLAKSIQRSLDLGHYEKAVNLLSSYLNTSHKNYLIPSKIKSSVFTAMNLFLMVDMVLAADSKELYQKLDSIVKDLLNSETREEVEYNTKIFCNIYLDHINLKVSKISPPIQNAINFIQDNYGNKITLEDVANHVYLNSSYLSQLFKKEIGTSFGDYLTDIRIKQAKILIRESDKSMNEIAEKVGFANQNYFTKVFKKSVGLSPSEYKKCH